MLRLLVLGTLIYVGYKIVEEQDTVPVSPERMAVKRSTKARRGVRRM